MAVPFWPSNVPYDQLRDGAAVPALMSDPATFETEAGPAIMRKRPGPDTTEISWRSVPWTGAQFSAFKAFVRTTLIGGTVVFDMPVFEPGSGYVTRKCQIKRGGRGVSLDESQAPWFSVSFTLIVYNW